MELSARNQLKGTVKEVRLGTVMAEVTLDVGGQLIVAAITRAAAERLRLRAGDEATAVIKATAVIIAK